MRERGKGEAEGVCECVCGILQSCVCVRERESREHLRYQKTPWGLID